MARKKVHPWASDQFVPTPDDHDANDWPESLTRSHVLGGNFLYLGIGLSLAAFADYIQTYHFGSTPPVFGVLHHTSIPDTQHARLQHGMWDAGEDGMPTEQIYKKRQRQLTNIMVYYRDQLGWNRGPHLFIDERWIWLFTPMYFPGIHARHGNGTVGGGYSIGIEVIGHYAQVQWPPAVERLVGGAVALLKQRLGTFDLTHQVGPGGISSHRDWGKPACPGDAITEEYYLDVLTRAWHELRAGTLIDHARPPTPAEEPGCAETRVIGVGQQAISPAFFRDVCQRRGFGLSNEECDRVYTLASDLNIRADFLVATGLAEHGEDLQQSDLFRASFNVGNMIWYPGTPYKHLLWPRTGRTYRVFESPQIAMLTMLLHLKDYYGGQGLLTVEDIAPVWLAHTPEENMARISRLLIDMRAMEDASRRAKAAEGCDDT